MKGYKISVNGYCSGFKYEIGKTYTLKKGKLELCNNGFHFCKNFDDVFEWYDYNKDNTTIFEVEALGKIIEDNDKCVTDKIKILRIIPKREYNKLFKRHKFDKNNNLIKIIKWEYDKNNNLICEKTSDGFWIKWKYDKNNNKIYEEDSKGFWKKWEYDENNNLIYIKYSDGFWQKWEYDKNNNLIHYKNSNGFWEKWKYDENNNKIYYENSSGSWTKYRHDKNNNLVYLEYLNNYNCEAVK